MPAFARDSTFRPMVRMSSSFLSTSWPLSWLMVVPSFPIAPVGRSVSGARSIGDFQPEDEDGDSREGTYMWVDVEPVAFSAQLTRAVTLAALSDADDGEEKEYDAAAQVQMISAEAHRLSR
jgi:hypothetical protein